MYRNKLEALNIWKSSDSRKPLIIRGARQVGKTWLMKEFGKTSFKKFLYINFEDTPSLQSLFDSDFDMNRILTVLEIHSGISLTASDTLIIFDEIQSANRAITSLKYFCEKTPELFIIAAGSLLGITMPFSNSFPVGKVDFLDLQPLSFEEYLFASGEEKLFRVIKNKDWKTIKIFKEKLLNYLRTYFYVGGMPEVVSSFIKNKDFDEIRKIQKRIILSYESDFSKHAPHEIVPRIRMVWQSIPAQLAKENKKYIYGLLREGARAKDFELAIQWLIDAGLLKKINRITKPELPLTAFTDLSAFKLYLNDVGLLSAMVGLDSKSLIQGNELYLQFKGSLTEQFVAQQLQVKNDRIITYWTNERSTSEVDFVLQKEGEIIPIEVKAELNLKAKSFKLFCEKYKPNTAYRLSMADYKNEIWMENIPLYCIDWIY
jgi:predicted AAA+ superfamily ATPase